MVSGLNINNPFIHMADTSPLKILLLSSNPELLDWFRDDVAGIPDQSGGFVFLLSGEEHRVQTLTAPLSEEVPSPDSADLMLALVRYVDVISLMDMSTILESFPGEWDLPTCLMIYRTENETDFKMSCPYCGQKIWVRDADVDKRGRCPNCKKGFTLPRQDDHVGRALKLKEGVEIHRVERGNPASISAPLRALLRARQAVADSR